jgi:hypothetical protein
VIELDQDAARLDVTLRRERLEPPSDVVVPPQILQPHADP